MNQTINFMYFAWNHHPQQLKDMMRSMRMGEHMEDKFLKLHSRFNMNTTDMFLHWFMYDCSEQSKLQVCQWIEDNYTYKSAPGTLILTDPPKDLQNGKSESKQE